MTKLEKKLQELGYERQDKNHYKKLIRVNETFEHFEIYIQIGIGNKISGFLDCRSLIIYQHNLDNLQQAFNEMKRDLEELKKYEEEKI